MRAFGVDIVEGRRRELRRRVARRVLSRNDGSDPKGETFCVLRSCLVLSLCPGDGSVGRHQQITGCDFDNFVSITVAFGKCKFISEIHGFC